MAVELTKVALWIETVEPGKPLGFLDANIRLRRLAARRLFDLMRFARAFPTPPTSPSPATIRRPPKTSRSATAPTKASSRAPLTSPAPRRSNSQLPPLAEAYRAFRQLPEDTVADIDAKRDRFYSAIHDPRLQNLTQAANLYIAAFLTPKTQQQTLDPRTGVIPTTEDVWTAMRAGTVYGPRIGAVHQLASIARSFHWPLEFPDIMNAGGFDIVLGNPPWERIKLQEQEFFAAREPAIAEALNAAARGRLISKLKDAPPNSREGLLHAEFEMVKRTAEAASVFARVPGLDGGRFQLTGRGDVNTYALFAELFSSLTAPNGRAGIIVPTGLITDLGTSLFFSDLIDQKRLVQSLAFDNQRRIFPAIHPDTPFTLFTMGDAKESPRFGTYLLDIADLDDPRRLCKLTPSEIAAFNPNTRNAPLFRSESDAELSALIHSRIPVLLNTSRGAEGNPWDFDYLTKMFDMASSSAFFRESGTFAQKPRGTEIFEDDQIWRPLYEAKMINLYDHRWGQFDAGGKVELLERDAKTRLNLEPQPRYWVTQAKLDERLGRRWNRGWMLGWRDITNATNERTVIVSLYPRVGVGHTIRNIFIDMAPELIACFLANLSSLTVDYSSRQKVGGTHLTVEMIQQLPVLPPTAYTSTDLDFLVPRVLELTYTSHSMTPFARDLGFEGEPYAWDEDRRAILRAELDAWYARAYSLTRNQLRYILDPADIMGPDYPSETFRVLKNSEIRKFGEYRTQRLVLDAWDRMERGELHKPEPYQRPAAGTAPTAVTVSPRSGVTNQPSLQFVEADPE